VPFFSLCFGFGFCYVSFFPFFGHNIASASHPEAVKWESVLTVFPFDVGLYLQQGIGLDGILPNSILAAAAYTFCASSFPRDYIRPFFFGPPGSSSRSVQAISSAGFSNGISLFLALLPQFCFQL